MITCKQATDYISKQEEKGKLSLKQQVQLKWHLFTCSLCKRFSKQNKTLIKLLSADADSAEISLTDQEKVALINTISNSDPQ